MNFGRGFKKLKIEVRSLAVVFQPDSVEIAAAIYRAHGESS